MTIPCPEPRELARLLDGELTENRGALLRAHLAACADCAGELAAQRRLVERIAAPLPAAGSDRAAAEVMRRIDAAVAPAPRRQVGPRAWGWAVAAAAGVVVLALFARPPGHDEFAARGAAVAWSQKVGVELWALRDRPHRLADGDPLPAGAALVASYNNMDASPAWLLAFAVDAGGEVHWLYPAFLDPGSDPQSVRLEGSVVQRALPESVILQGVPDGAVRLVTVVTRAPLHVSGVESARPEDRTVQALRRRWPEARVDETVVHHGASAASGGNP